MEDKSRRKFLRKSGIVTGAVALSGIPSSAKPRPGKTSYQLRRDLSNPIAPAVIERQRKKVVRNSIKEGSYAHTQSSDGEELVGERSQLDLDDNEHIVAYNLEIVDGGPSEWIGTVTEKSEDSVPETDPSAQVQTQQTESAVDKVHRQADADAEKKKVQSSTISTQDVSSDYSDWPVLLKTEGYDVVSKCCGYADGQDTGWTYEWRSPNNVSEAAVKCELRMHPRAGDYDAWQVPPENEWAKLKFDYNSSAANVLGYGPGNTVGRSSSSWDIQVSSDSVVSVGYSSTNYKSDIQANNYSNIDSDERVEHKWDIYNNLRTNTVVLNSVAGSDNDPAADTRFVSIDGNTRYAYDGKSYTDDVGKSVTYKWS